MLLIKIIILDLEGNIQKRIILLNSLNKNLKNTLTQLFESVLKAFKYNKKIILIGNGGSFSIAQHISSEFTGRFLLERRSLPSIVLGSNPSSLTAISNDYGYENSFARELSSLGNEGDIVIAMSTSGKSKNILKTMELASSMNIESFFLTGDICFQNSKKIIHIPLASKETDLVQEIHFTILHELCKYIDQKLFT